MVARDAQANFLPNFKSSIWLEEKEIKVDGGQILSVVEKITYCTTGCCRSCVKC